MYAYAGLRSHGRGRGPPGGTALVVYTIAHRSDILTLLTTTFLQSIIIYIVHTTTPLYNCHQLPRITTFAYTIYTMLQNLQHVTDVTVVTISQICIDFLAFSCKTTGYGG
jgi:hypothetical protein